MIRASSVCCLFLLFCVCALAMSNSAVPRRTNGVGAGSTRVMTLGESAHYPKLPREIVSKHLGVRLELLTDAANRQEIVAWADGHSLTRGCRIQSLVSTEPNTQWLMLMHIWTSGRQAWNVYLYAYHPLKSKDPKPWKLFYVGGNKLETKHLNDIACVYIDSSKRALVFAEKNGKLIASIPIGSELKVLEGR